MSDYSYVRNLNEKTPLVKQGELELKSLIEDFDTLSDRCVRYYCGGRREHFDVVKKICVNECVRHVHRWDEKEKAFYFFSGVVFDSLQELKPGRKSTIMKTEAVLDNDDPINQGRVKTVSGWLAPIFGDDGQAPREWSGDHVINIDGHSCYWGRL